jgi:major membrane immunogen (membrane-anchored lipoprotein)
VDVLKNVKPGRWEVRYCKNDDEAFYRLELLHRSTMKNENLDWVVWFEEDAEWKAHSKLIVDAGKMSVISDTYYRRKNGSIEEFESDEVSVDTFTEKCSKLTYYEDAGLIRHNNKKVGVVCSTGIGDGRFLLEIVEKDSEIIAMKIDFIWV